MFLEQQGCGDDEDMLIPGDAWLTTPSWHICFGCGGCGGGRQEEEERSIVYSIIYTLYDNNNNKNIIIITK